MNDQTLRQRLEAIRDERNRVHMGEPYAAYAESMRAITAHAVAALGLMSQPHLRVADNTDWLLVWDPETTRALGCEKPA
jgi:hypothetical protein